MVITLSRVEWLNFRHLYAFWCVSKYGGFQKAAQRIAVSQSALSEQVQQLEEYLDEHLLERTTRSLKITERGVALLAYADEIFARSQLINHLFKEKNESPQPSEIRIGMVGGISRNFLFRLIHQNLHERRGLHIRVVDGSLDELNTLLKGYELDLVFTLDVPRTRDLVTLGYKTVGASPICLAGRPDMVAKVKRRRSQALKVELFMFNQPREGSQLEDTLRSRFNLDMTVSVSTDDISLLRFLANSSRGLAVIPEVGIQEDLDAGILSKVRLTECLPAVFHAVFLKNGFHHQLVQDFLS